ncbi:conserved hypothetical protein [Talaromyces stipitatus ATCC 10500]|uniref:Uncharacterized protein n=1 Tax=Talaromyces stipitatus (strain ATCC 10500 / CBS 375.48 / QM 6759 / NRRL 1006) TaxID=441959 RepID=B8LZC1_TALSN|nr:uncharacterized protein TSTA_089100 [Talaromyces stipitatus ATCC 10500]EED21674.1 conserved hypothetical protein [Talaromyces stipitatus ATCC 10500]
MSSSNPDLSSVLRTLSAFANPASTPPPQQPQHHKRPTHTTSTSPQRPTPSLNPELPPPSAITTWPSALKHVMHLTSQNKDLSVRIQHLIKSQRDHERTWWKAREALIAKQASREEKKRRLEEVLFVFIPSFIQVLERKKEDNASELKAYDSKVYQASLDMSRSMETELRRLGVPFFCIDRSLVLEDYEGKGKGKERTEGESRSTTLDCNKTSKISSKELEALKKRVLDLLVDLCS